MRRSTKFILVILNYISQLLTLGPRSGEEFCRSKPSFSQPQTWNLPDKKMLYKSVNSTEAEKGLRDILLSNILDCGLAASCLFIPSVICKGKKI